LNDNELLAGVTN